MNREVLNVLCEDKARPITTGASFVKLSYPASAVFKYETPSLLPRQCETMCAWEQAPISQENLDVEWPRCPEVPKRMTFISLDSRAGWTAFAALASTTTQRTGAVKTSAGLENSFSGSWVDVEPRTKSTLRELLEKFE